VEEEAGVALAGSKDHLDKFVHFLQAKMLISLHFRQGSEPLIDLVGNVGRDRTERKSAGSA
jgi:hypothetical protein